MAIKKLTFDDGVLVSEETVDKPKRKPPPPPPKKSGRPRKGRASTGRGAERRPAAGTVKITAKAESGPKAKAGKSVLEQNVIKFRCPRCSSERVADSKDARLTCGLCGAAMKLVH